MTKYILCFIISFIYVSVYSQEAPKGYETDFNREHYYGNWSSIDMGGHDYSFFVNKDTSVNSDVLDIDVDKDDWQFLQLWLNRFNLSHCPLISFDIKSDKNGELEVSAVGDKFYNKISQKIKIDSSREYKKVFFSFSGDIDKIKGNLQELQFQMNDRKPLK
jgi:hypothetical protein